MGSWLVPSYYPVSVITTISALYVHAKQDCKKKRILLFILTTVSPLLLVE